MSTFFKIATEFNNDRLPMVDYPNDNLTALYEMNQPIVDNVIIDSSGNMNNGLGNGVTLDSEGAVFNESFISTNILLSSEQTIFIVFKTDTIPNGENRFIAGAFDEASDFYVRGVTNQFNGRIDTGTSSLLRGNIAKSRIENNWVFAALSCKDGKQELIIPQAGVSFTDSVASSGTIGVTSDKFTLGWDSAGNAGVPKFSGKFALAGVYSRYMTQKQLYGLFNVAKRDLLSRGIELNTVI